jgi:RNA polymerase sigma-70 factor (ECF subfamily)
MDSTSPTLLQRLRRPSEEGAWGRFVQLYSPLLYHWARRLGLAEADAADLVQEVFTILVQKLPEFRYDPGKGFRGWLWTVLRNKWRDHVRRGAGAPAGGDPEELADVAAPEDSGLLGEAEYREHLVRRALQIMQAEFSPRTWKACWEHVALGRSAAEVAAELGISVGSVYVAKSRVMSRLRQELEGLLD